jgi:starch phosphorylase
LNNAVGLAAAAQVDELKNTIQTKLRYVVGKDAEHASTHDWFVATALAVRDRIVDRWIETTRRTQASGRKRVYYLSLEFLIGRLLTDSMSNLGIQDDCRAALADLGVDFDAVREVEPDAALGNGGLGRLAACFMESMASIGVAGFGYGIRYDHGLFRQAIRDGWQVESPEDWLAFGNPWEFERPEVNYPIGFGGSVEEATDGDGNVRHSWAPGEYVDAVAYDTPVVGWRGKRVNTLRLWSARANEPLLLAAFNSGDYIGAQAGKARAEAISKVLYPSDETPAGQELRLRQEYFFASASLQDLLRRQLRQHGELRSLAEHASIQLNDTHPAISVAELMRLLFDVHGLAWDEAWRITQATLSYTNHTLLPEALESWPVPLLERLLPRHMQIVYLINALHLDGVRKAGHDDPAFVSSVSMIDEHAGRRVRMGHLALIGSHKVNGVSALHSELLRQTVFRDFNTLWPDRIVNKTNGITFRRWLFEANPGLTRLLADVVGPAIWDDPTALHGLEAHVDDPALHDALAAIKRRNKVALSKIVLERCRVKVDPDALFDVQIKRVHEYKRQLLNILETVALYDAMRAHPRAGWMPTVKIFAGKAAASYHNAKLIIKLANDVARVVNADPTLHGLLKVAYLPNYNVSLAEAIIPAADLSEQISTAGMEASGTGNMKLALNGALTIGTLDGANVEIMQHVGEDNIFIFGLTTEQVAERRSRGTDMREEIAASSTLTQALEQIESGVFSPDDPARYRDLVDILRHHDYFMVCADFDAYCARQRDVARHWHDRAAWWRSSALNTARMGWFSSDRAIGEYASGIWGLQPEDGAAGPDGGTAP